MAKPDSTPTNPSDPKRRNVYSDSRVTVAFPFSTVRVGGDDRLGALAALVAELAVEVGRLAETEATADLRRRAEALAGELQ